MAISSASDSWLSIVSGLALVTYLASGFNPPAPDPESVTIVTVSRDDALERHWDEIREFLAAKVPLEACNTSSGRCYALYADFASGKIGRAHFPNGGTIEIGEQIGSDGGAFGFDARGTGWEFLLDMDSTAVNDAVQQWASVNGYTVR